MVPFHRHVRANPVAIRCAMMSRPTGYACPHAGHVQEELQRPWHDQAVHLPQGERAIERVMVEWRRIRRTGPGQGDGEENGNTPAHSQAPMDKQGLARGSADLDPDEGYLWWHRVRVGSEEGGKVRVHARQKQPQPSTAHTPDPSPRIRSGACLWSLRVHCGAASRRRTLI